MNKMFIVALYRQILSMALKRYYEPNRNVSLLPNSILYYFFLVEYLPEGSTLPLLT